MHERADKNRPIFQYEFRVFTSTASSDHIRSRIPGQEAIEGDDTRHGGGGNGGGEEGGGGEGGVTVTFT